MTSLRATRNGNGARTVGNGTSERAGKLSHATRQRERILDAAEKCFIESGFHAASMAHIAETAGISAGLIYRYFDSKAKIVKAIIECHLETEGNCSIERLHSSDDVSEAMLDIFERWRRGDDPKINAGLFLELTAACTRDTAIARVVRDKDRVVSEGLAQAVQRIARARGVHLSSAAARDRADMLQCLVEGLASRVVRDPALRRQSLKPMLDKVIAALLA
ncbi:MAG TPA: TetR/AcrR family transcriptional regulator [Steroidobacteraceae bacterium]|jgi:AcrR family transcriptional regulator